MNIESFIQELGVLADERQKFSEYCFNENDYEQGRMHQGAAVAYRTACAALKDAWAEEEFFLDALRARIREHPDSEVPVIEISELRHILGMDEKDA
jgi:hypothetical protein